MFGKGITCIFAIDFGVKMNQNYKASNFIALALAGFFCIANVLFLVTTQPLYILKVVGISQDGKIGKIIGSLGVADELTAIIAAPLLGTLNDKITSSAYHVAGSRIIVLASFLCISLSFIGYSQNSSIIGMFIFRLFFALGVSGCMNMLPVMLHLLSFSDFRFQKLLFWREQDTQSENDRSVNSGKYSACVGAFTGLGALYGVYFFLPMPVIIDNFTSLSYKASLQLSYFIIGIFSMLTGLVLFKFIYNSVLGGQSDDESAEITLEHTSFIQLLKKGLVVSKQSKKIQMAHGCAFVARSSTVANTVFVPLVVFTYFRKMGLCDSGTPVDGAIQECQQAYFFSAMLIGIAQLIALLSSPFWAWLIDLTLRPVTVAAIFGSVGNLALCLLGLGSTPYDPRNVTCFLVVCLLGCSQYGYMLNALGLLSSFKSNPNIGSISGLNSLCGGVGILCVSLIGGLWSDYWIMGPFFVLAIFNLALLYASTKNYEDDMLSLPEQSD
ncbi:uncharacterized protein PRCAT00005353001 [Priceomyces carsonii]|uniref:uncharacterized protein n=1 Tax=Priceomyces carsonii TaxID=28549 RepID=UPI002ED95E88|nr:unnamed protein product [Priceomyces carsonii]